MFHWLGRLLRGLAELVISLIFALLLGWQALGMGVIYDLTACVLVGVGGLLTFFALVAFHELGHLIAARAVGLPFTRFTLGLLMFAREGKRVRVRLNTAWFQPAAYVLHALPNGCVRPRLWAVVVFAGPLCNLLLGLTCLIAANWLNPGPPTGMSPDARVGWRNVALLFPGNMVIAQLNVAGLLSLGMGMATLIPGSAAGLRTDGGQLLDLWRRKGSPGKPLRR
jgi:membrane-associated protease RseP (regulator of RpoE activity)